MPKTQPVPTRTLAERLIEHVLILDHLQNLHRAHGDTEVDPLCSCGTVLGRVQAAAKCVVCEHPREEHRKPHLEGCQRVVAQIRTVAEIDETRGLPTGKTLDVVERAACECGEFRSVPASTPRRADLIDTWLKHAGLPENPVRDHCLVRIVGTYVPPDQGPAAPAIAHCLCGEHLIADGADVTDPAAAIVAWAEHVQSAEEA